MLLQSKQKLYVTNCPITLNLGLLFMVVSILVYSRIIIVVRSSLVLYIVAMNGWPTVSFGGPNLPGNGGLNAPAEVSMLLLLWLCFLRTQ